MRFLSFYRKFLRNIQTLGLQWQFLTVKDHLKLTANRNMDKKERQSSARSVVSSPFFVPVCLCLI